MKRPDWNGWSEWHKLLDAIPLIENRRGVYMIAADKSLTRLHGEDEEGILDIGESNRVQARVKHFISCANGTCQLGHAAGWRYRHLNYSSLFPLHSLYVSWKYAEGEEDEYQMEGALLREYVQQHFELPPLNYKYNYEKPKFRR